jgi:hypothetical protein
MLFTVLGFPIKKKVPLNRGGALVQLMNRVNREGSFGR